MAYMRRALFLFLLVLIIGGVASVSAMRAQTVRKQTSSQSSAALSSTKSSKARAVRSSVSSKSASSVTVAKPLTPPTNLRIPILVYHHIRENQGWGPDTWSAKMSVSPKGFEKQMLWLSDHNYTSINLDTYVQIMKGERQGPQKPVVITFDDNVLSAYELGVPIMEKYGMMGVFYLVADRIDSKTMINRERAQDLLKRGMDIQSHTLAHRVLTALPVEELDRDLKESKRILEELTGKPVLHVAYPGTAHNATVREHAAKAGYITGTIMDPRAATEKDDLMKLPRIMMIDSTDLKKVLP